MPYDPESHHRRSIRLKGYDYSQGGAYFVTICTQDGRLLLADSDVHNMIDTWWEKLPAKFPAVDIDAQVVMPNHIHGIVVIRDSTTIRPQSPGGSGEGLSTDLAAHFHPKALPEEWAGSDEAAPTLGQVVRWFKTMTTNAYIRGVKERGWQPFATRLWQRNYYEQIIRNERHLAAIQQYISDNPANWDADV